MLNQTIEVIYNHTHGGNMTEISLKTPRLRKQELKLRSLPANDHDGYSSDHWCGSEVVSYEAITSC